MSDCLCFAHNVLHICSINNALEAFTLGTQIVEHWPFTHFFSKAGILDLSRASLGSLSHPHPHPTDTHTCTYRGLLQGGREPPGP